jgi:alanine racemase
MQPEQIHRPVWAEIHLDHLHHNLEQIRKRLNAGIKVCAVVKANGYGHGAVVLAQELERINVDHLAVATLTEAIELREHNCTLPILIFGYTPESEAPLLIKYDLKQTIYTKLQAKAFSDAAVLAGSTICLHLKIDTGMSRLGFQTTEQDVQDIMSLFEYPGLEIEGIYTHFAAADEPDKTETRKQLDKFIRVTSALKKMVLIFRSNTQRTVRESLICLKPILIW